MIIIYHLKNKVVEVEFEGEAIPFSEKGIAFNIFEIATKYPDQLIMWCRFDLKVNLNREKLNGIFHHNKIMATYDLSLNSFLPDAIGYVEESLFLNVKKNVSYPTWMMASDVGGVNSSILKALKDEINVDLDFDYFLHSMAKLTMMNGLFCYSEPLLLQNVSEKSVFNKESNFLLFRFVKQHYKTRWVFLLFLNLFLYENKISILPLLTSLFYKKRKLKENILDKIIVESTRKVVFDKKLSVIIPTIGRKKYLYDFLKDLSQQTSLPQKVIIVEQNPNLNSVTELDYVVNENWPFDIKHIFTHQAGACNARNLALAEVESEWVFMADDDIRIERDFLEKAFNQIEKNGCEQITFGCYQVDYPESKKEKQKIQWDSFGSGCSIVKTKNVRTISYNNGFEFGYGEDSDFGAQLRNLGFDIIHSPNPEIIHLKAPIGGFRSKPVLGWAHDSIQPKPSPTVMLYKILNLKKEQVYGYKTILFFKFYKYQKIKNPIKYLMNFHKQWQASVYWAGKLNQ